jgi:HlyD family secretion protein
MKTRNTIALGLSLAAVAALVAWSLQPRPVAVEVAKVAQGPFEQSIVDDGKTRVRERYVIAAPLAGRVERISLEAGDIVRAGETVALLTPTAPAFLDARTARELQARIGAADAQLARARAEKLKVLAQRDQARADLARQEKLATEGFVSATAREQAELALRTVERAVDAAGYAEEAARHELEQARAALVRYRSSDPTGKWEVTSPVNGSVLRVIQKSESPVALGAPLLEVADARSLEAVVDILSQDAVAVRPGMRARVELGQGVASVPALVRLVEPAAFTKVSALGVEEQRVNVVLDFAGPLDRIWTLGDAFRVEAHIVTYHEDKAVKVPVGALFREGEGWAVFAVENGRAVKRVVKVPRRNGVEAMVQEGLKPGERVVVYPSDALRDGTKVEIVAGGR